MSQRHLVRRAIAFAALLSLPVLGAMRQEPQTQVLPPQDPQGQAEAKPDPRTPLQQALSEIRKVLLLGGRAEAEQVAGRVRELGRGALEERERESWVRVAREVALRLGDRAWLEELRLVPDGFASEANYVLLLAKSQLEHANLGGARRTLDLLGDLEELNPRDSRRAQALRARVAQLAGDGVAERTNVRELIGHLDQWPRQGCQICHAQTKQPDVVTSLAIDRLWFGERYVAHLREDGTAAAVRADCERRLAARATDDDARIHLAFALRALGDEAGAQARFAELPWAALADRPGTKPMQMASYP